MDGAAAGVLLYLRGVSFVMMGVGGGENAVRIPPSSNVNQPWPCHPVPTALRVRCGQWVWGEGTLTSPQPLFP